MIKLLTIIGARPQIIKAAALSRAIRQINRAIRKNFSNKIKEISALGHEIGYHYEDIDLASQSIKYQVPRQKKNLKKN